MKKVIENCPYDVECAESDYGSLEICQTLNYKDCPNYVSREQANWGWYWPLVRRTKITNLEKKLEE